MVAPNEPGNRVFEFTNQYGEWLKLTFALDSQTAKLSSCDFDAVTIQDDRIQNAELILSGEESAWLASVWRQVTGRELAKLPFTRIAEGMREYRQQSGDDC